MIFTKETLVIKDCDVVYSDFTGTNDRMGRRKIVVDFKDGIAAGWLKKHGYFCGLLPYKKGMFRLTVYIHYDFKDPASSLNSQITTIKGKSARVIGPGNIKGVRNQDIQFADIQIRGVTSKNDPSKKYAYLDSGYFYMFDIQDCGLKQRTVTEEAESVEESKSKIVTVTHETVKVVGATGLRSSLNPRTVSSNIRAFRLSNHMTQAELATKVGLTNVSISNYESGKHLPSEDTLNKIARFFGIPTMRLGYSKDDWDKLTNYVEPMRV